MFRASLIFLVCLLAFGLFFSLAPLPSEAARAAVVLHGVHFNLYPQQDPEAVWRFQAKEVRFDPSKGENTLGGLEKGERWLTRSDGAERLDQTLDAKNLVIDAEDNLSAQEAKVYIPSDCFSLDFKAVGDRPVVINQRSGYTAPYVRILSPSLNGEFDDFSAGFDLTNVQTTQHAGMTAQSYPDTVCVNGKAVSRTSESSK